MSKRTYEKYIKNGCHPIGYNEPCQSYYFGQVSVDFLLDQIDQLKQQLEEKGECRMNEDLMNKNLIKWWETHRKPNSTIKIFTIDEEGQTDKPIHISLEEIQKEEWYIPFIMALQNKNIKEVRFIAD